MFAQAEYITDWIDEFFYLLLVLLVTSHTGNL